VCVLKSQKNHPRNWREEICCQQNTIAKQRKKIEKRKRRSSEGVLLVVKMRVLPMMVLKKPPSNPKAFLFDIDGTLCDSDPVHFECFLELIEKFPSVKNPTRKPIDHDFFRKHIAGGSNPIIFNNLYPDLSEEERERMWTEKEKEYRRRAITSLRRLNGLSELMSQIDAQKIPKVAVTNAPRENADMMLKALQLDVWFKELVVLGGECEHAKPHPQPYIDGLRLLGLDPIEDAKDCIVFEDSPSGATAAVAAGCFVVGVMTSQKAEHLLEVGVHMTVKDFEEFNSKRREYKSR
jgi:HAD superfamily hydrolase (TIGR01509 family)